MIDDIECGEAGTAVKEINQGNLVEVGKGKRTKEENENK